MSPPARRASLRAAALALAATLAGCPTATIELPEGPLVEARDYPADLASVAWLGLRGPALERTDCAGATLLHLAAWRGDHATVDRLIRLGAAVEARDARGDTPLMLAARAGHLEVIERLLAVADPLAVDRAGRSALHHAAAAGHLPVARRLLVLANLWDHDATLPLHLAALHDRAEVLAALLDHRPEPAIVKAVEAQPGAPRSWRADAPNAAGETPLHFAARGGAMASTTLLLARGAPVDARARDARTPLHAAAASPRPRPELVRALLAAGADPRAKDSAGSTPLHLAASLGQLEVAQVLIDASRSLEDRDNSGRTPLEVAIDEGRSEVAAALVTAHADLAARDGERPSPLERAIAGGSPTLVRRLLVALSARRLTGGATTAEPRLDPPALAPLLELAARTSPLDSVASLLERGADPGLAPPERPPPLWSALAAGRLDNAALLLARGAPVDARHGPERRTALHLACARRDAEAIALLLAHDPDLGAMDAARLTPVDLLVAPSLDDAEDAARVDALETLLRLTPVPATAFRRLPALTPAEQAMAMQASPAVVALLGPPDDLHWATHRGDRARVEALLAADPAAIRRLGPDGLAPLHRAVGQGHRDVARLLLERGAPVDQRASRKAGAWAGASPLHLAVWRGDADLVALLLDAGAARGLRDATGRRPVDRFVSARVRDLARLVELLPELPTASTYPSDLKGVELDLDADGDGIPDPDDRCPDNPETRNGVADDDGCPEAITVENRGPPPSADAPLAAGRWDGSLRLATGPGSELLPLVDRVVEQDVFDPAATEETLAPLRTCAAAAAWHAVARLAEIELLTSPPSDAPRPARHTLARAWLGLGRHAEAEPALTELAQAFERAEVAARGALRDAPTDRRARRLAAHQTSREERARTLDTLALSLENRAKYAEAARVLAESVATRRPPPDAVPLPGDRLWLSWGLAQLARVYLLEGRYAEALSTQREVLDLRERALPSDDRLVRLAIANLGVFLGLVGDEDKARAFASRHLQLIEYLTRPSDDAAADLAELAVARHNVARFRLADGDPQGALALLARFDAAGAAWHPSGWLAARLRRSLAEARLAVGDRAGAERDYRRALAELEAEIGDHPEVARLLLDLADLHHDDLARAHDTLSRAWIIATRAQSPEVRWRVELALSRLEARRGRHPQAILFGKRAVTVLEDLRAQVAPLGPDLERAYLEGRIDAWRELAALLIDAGRLEEAHAVLDRLRVDEARTVVRGLAPTGDPLTATPAERSGGQRLDALGAELATIGSELAGLAQKRPLAAPERKREAELETALADARRRFKDELAAIDDELEEENLGATTREARTEVGDRIAEVTQAKLLLEKRVGPMLGRLGHGAVIVHYLLGREHLRIFVSTPKYQIARRVPFEPRALTSQVFALREALRSHDDAVLVQARELYAALVGPIEAELREAGAETLMLALDGPLRYVPFAALHDGERFLVERYRLANVTPSAAASLEAPPRPDWSIAAFGTGRAFPGYTPLAAVGPELEGLVRRDANDPDGVLPGLVALDQAFTREALRVLLGAADHPVVHIASHFVFEPFDPEASHLLLGDGQPLSLAAIADSLIFENVDLLTLSACNTAVGDATADEQRVGRRRGREIEGLAQVALQNGANAVLATLWPVADQTTADLMRAFYRLHAAHPELTKADALRLAMLGLMRGVDAVAPADFAPLGPRPAGAAPSAAPALPDAAHAHPFYWAPFVLIGNWL